MFHVPITPKGEAMSERYRASIETDDLSGATVRCLRKRGGQLVAHFYGYTTAEIDTCLAALNAAAQHAERDELLRDIIKAIRDYYDGDKEYIPSRTCLIWLARFNALNAKEGDGGL